MITMDIKYHAFSAFEIVQSEYRVQHQVSWVPASNIILLILLKYCYIPVKLKGNCHLFFISMFLVVFYRYKVVTNVDIF